MKRFLNEKEMRAPMHEDTGINTFVDRRRNESSKEGITMCRKCGCTLISLPNDRRRGFCYDCYDPLETEDVIRIPSVIQSHLSRK